MTDSWVLGIDENGLGPRLGPLIVTAIGARVEDRGRAVLTHRPRGGLAQRLGDSKALLSHGNVALGEAWARAVGERMGHLPDSPEALLRAISLDQPAVLRRDCPPSVLSQCWNSEAEAFTSAPGVTALVQRDLERLAKRGVDVREARVAIVCTKHINRALGSGRSRFDIDLWEMERLILALEPQPLGSRAAPRSCGEPGPRAAEAGERSGTLAGHAHGSTFEAICGKVGGYTRYGPAFGPLAGRLHSVIEETRRRSTYFFPGLGRVSFLQDADAEHLLVGMASMVGKWVRELLMARIVRHYGEHGAGHDASGYYDPVTERFFQATARFRREHAIPGDCFERRSGPDAGPIDGLT